MFHVGKWFNGPPSSLHSNDDAHINIDYNKDSISTNDNALDSAYDDSMYGSMERLLGVGISFINNNYSIPDISDIRPNSQ